MALDLDERNHSTLARSCGCAQGSLSTAYLTTTICRSDMKRGATCAGAMIVSATATAALEEESIAGASARAPRRDDSIPSEERLFWRPKRQKHRIPTTQTTPTSKKARVISNLTPSHALFSPASYYYDGALPVIAFDLKDSDVLIAPRQLINCNHTGTKHFVEQFLIVAEYYTNYPRRRQSIVHNLVSQISGHVYALKRGDTWERVSRRGDLVTKLTEIMDATVQYRKSKRQLEETAVPLRRRQVPPTRVHADFNDQKDTHNHTQEYWDGLCASCNLDGSVRLNPLLVSDNDVLLTQRALWKNHPGTVYFGRLLNLAIADRDNFDLAAQKILEIIQERGGHFLEARTSGKNTEWRRIKDMHELTSKIRILLESMGRLESRKQSAHVALLQPEDVLLTMSFTGHFGTGRFQILLLKIKALFIKAESGYILARKIRSQVEEQWGGKFFAKTNKYNNTSSTEAAVKPLECAHTIELKIVSLLEYLEALDFRAKAVEHVQFAYPPTSSQLVPPPTQTDVFLGKPFDRADIIPPGNIRFFRMIRDRCVLCSSRKQSSCSTTTEAEDIIRRIRAYGGRFLIPQQDETWQPLTDHPVLVSLIAVRFERLLAE